MAGQSRRCEKDRVLRRINLDCVANDRLGFVGAEKSDAVVDAVGSALLTSYGLRSLNPDHIAHRGDYGGDAFRRDSGYHQGPVWTWLIGAYVEAHYRIYGDREAALALMHPFETHLRDAMSRFRLRNPRRRSAAPAARRGGSGVRRGRGAACVAAAGCVSGCRVELNVISFERSTFQRITIAYYVMMELNRS